MPRGLPATATLHMPTPPWPSSRLRSARSPGESPAILLPPAKRRTRPFIAAAAACFAAIIGIGLLVKSELLPDHDAGTAAAEGPTAITLASLPAGTTIPRLDTAGLKLIGLAIDPGKVPLFTATYRGPHGCRLDLRAWSIGSGRPGARRHQPAQLDCRRSCL